MKPLTYRLAFPRDLTSEQVLALLLALSGSSTVNGRAMRFGVRGMPGAIEHRLSADPAQAPLVGRLPGLAPGLLVREESPEAADSPSFHFLWRFWQSSSRRPMRADRPELTSRAILSALAHVRRDEVVELQWLLGPVRRPLSVGSRHAGVTSESWAMALAQGAIREPGDLDADARYALRQKRAEPGWRLIGQVAVAAADQRRARALAASVVAGVRTAEGPGVRFGVRRRPIRQLNRQPWKWALDLRAPELVGLLAFPIGTAGIGLPVDVQRARVLMSRTPQPRQGRSLGLLADDRKLRIADRDSRRHLLITGPTGSGKSVLLQTLVAQDIAHGHGVLVIDPKGDLVEALLGSAIPEHRRDDLVVLDPTDRAPVGINPLHKPPDPSLAADQILGIFTTLFDDLGPRTTDILANALLELSRWGNGSLSLLAPLLTNAALRRRILAATPTDPLGTAPFWQWFNGLKDSERQFILAAGLNKIRRLTVQPELRAIFGQVEPRFSLNSMVRGTPIVLVSLAKGRTGPEASAILASTVIRQAWSALQGRGALPANRRRHFGIYVDETAEYLKVGEDLGELLVLSRALGVGFTMATQNLAQFPRETLSVVRANARSVVAFQAGADDARVLAQGHPELDPADFMGLAPFHAYASLVSGNEVQPFVSLRTEPPPGATVDSAALRAHARSRFGRPRQQVDAALIRLIGKDSPDARTEVLGQRPRRQP